MCGIAGYIGKATIDESRIIRTLDLMQNRGPDFRDHISFTQGDVNVSLLHSRLKIIDLEERSNQPFTIGDHTIVYNGEIYNYVELREQLELKGVQFRTESDTEVLLQCYIEYGEECVKQFEGMWSFAIYSHKTGNLFLSRDRFAEKPLYYFLTSNGIYFASEVKFLQSLMGQKFEVNYHHLLRYLVNGYRSLYKTQDTYFINVKELSNASNMVIDGELKITINRYWQPTFEPQEMSSQEAIENFRQRLLNSMKIRLRADVPLAFCLSGGVDSASLTSISAKVFNYDVHTFSIIDQDTRYNEYDNIRATIDDLGCRHTIIEIPQTNPFPRLKDLVRYHDAPVITITYYVHSLLSEAINKAGYRVAVSGHGADEMATGYYDHFNMYLYEMRNSPKYQKYLDDWRNYPGQFVRNPFLQNPELFFDNPEFRGHIYLDADAFAEFLQMDFSEGWMETKYSESLLRSRMLNELLVECVPIALHEDDLNSMMYSIENRSPFLDSQLCEMAYSIPTELLIQDGYGKYILREAVKGILNEKVRTDRRKVGFNASFNSLVNVDDKETREYLLDNSKIYDIVDRDMIERMLPVKPLSDSFNKFMFSFVSAKMFLDTYG